MTINNLLSSVVHTDGLVFNKASPDMLRCPAFYLI